MCDWNGCGLRWLKVLKRLRRILLAHRLDLARISVHITQRLAIKCTHITTKSCSLSHDDSRFLESFEDLCEQIADDVEHLVIVVANGDLQIETDKLGQVTMRVRVLGSEHWTTEQTHTWKTIMKLIESFFLSITSVKTKCIHYYQIQWCKRDRNRQRWPFACRAVAIGPSKPTSWSSWRGTRLRRPRTPLSTKRKF